MLPLLCLLVGVALPVGAAGVLLRRGLRPLAAATAYRNAAWRLGLDVDTRGLSLRGRVDGRRLFVGEALDEGRPRVRAVLDLAFPLGLGLVVRRRTTRRLRLRRPRVAVVTGDRGFDAAFEIRAFDPDRAARLLTAPVRAAVTALARSHPDLELSDRWVRLSLRRHPPNDRWLLDLVDRLVNLVLAVEQAREGVPPDDRLAPVAAAWAPLAVALGGQLLPTLPAVRGTFHGHAFTVHAVHYADAPHAELRLARTPSTAALHVAPRRPDVVGQDLRLGDPAFDAAFVVKGRDVAAVARALGPEARAALLALRDVIVDDERVWLPEAPVEPDALRARLEAAWAAVEALDAGR